MDYLNKELVSIIVPVYNSSAYIENCVSRLLCQSYKNIEIILVDDGSSDDSLDKCRILSQLDTRICVYSKKNSGASSARNMGIEYAHGYWLVFVDSDDIVKVDYVKHLVDGAYLSSADFVVSGIQYWNTQTECRIDKVYENRLLEDDNLVECIVKYRIYENGGPFSKLYKASIIHDHSICFNENLHYAEDCDFMLKYILFINSLFFINSVDYIYRLTPNSLSHRRLSLISEEMCLLEMQKRYQDLSFKFKEYTLNLYKASIIQYYLRVLLGIVDSNLCINDKIVSLQSLIYKCKGNYTDSEYRLYQPYCINDRILYKLLWLGSPFMILIYAKLIFPILRFLYKISR